MENLTTYQGVRIDDTTEWRLVVYISDRGMSAYLKNIEDPLQEVITLFEDKWEKEESSLLRRIETAVYNHPQLMDDFSTEIVVCSPKSMWVPEEVVEEGNEEVDLYNKIYMAEAGDVMSDCYDGMICLYTLTPGLRAFLHRTLSGARISCHLSLMVKRFMSRGADIPRLYADIRDGEVDFVVLDERRMLLSCTHLWHDKMDIAYHIFNLINVYGLDPQNTQVSLSGMKEEKQALLKILREHIDYVMLTMMPSAVSKTEMPIAAAIAITGTRD